MLKSSLYTFYGRHDNLIDRYEISLSQMILDLYFLRKYFLSSITATTFTGLYI